MKMGYRQYDNSIEMEHILAEQEEITNSQVISCL
jgi:hypothetical protein